MTEEDKVRKFISDSWMKQGLGVHQGVAIPQEMLRSLLEECDQLRLENQRLSKLIEIADVLITNDNAKEDWEHAKQIRVM